MNKTFRKKFNAHRKRHGTFKERYRRNSYQEAAIMFVIGIFFIAGLHPITIGMGIISILVGVLDILDGRRGPKPDPGLWNRLMADGEIKFKAERAAADHYLEKENRRKDLQDKE